MLRTGLVGPHTASLPLHAVLHLCSIEVPCLHNYVSKWPLFTVIVITMASDQRSVEEYLRNNPDFVKEWFLKNIDREELAHWLGPGDLTPRSRASSFTNIAGNHGARNSVTSNMFKDLICGTRKSSSLARTRMDRDKLLGQDERTVFMELIRDIANELDVNILCHKILTNVNILTKSDRSSLFLSRGCKNHRYLVSKLFDVSELSTLDDSLHTEDNEIRVPFGMGIAGTVAETKLPINIKDAYEDPRFNKEVDKKTGYRTKSLLCMPILNYDGDLMGVAQIMNKTDASNEFSKQDEEVFKNYLTFCGIGLTNAQLFEMSVEEYKRNQMLLQLARNIFEEQSNLDNLVQKIMLDAQDMLKCERCSVYLIDDSLEGNVVFSKAFELHANYKGNITKPTAKSRMSFSEEGQVCYSFETVSFVGNSPSSRCENLEKSRSAEIAREVAADGELLMIADLRSDPRYGEDIVNFDGFKIRSLLCLPICDQDKKVIGVVQLLNKLNGKLFSENDVNALEAFTIFCGLGVHNCQIYENALKLMAKQNVALEILSYHASASKEETNILRRAPIPTAEQYNLLSYHFDDYNLADDETCMATVRMFLDCDVTGQFHVPYETLCRWVLSVKKNYRPVTYHNWRHAFNVTQTMFTMLYTGNMEQYMDSLEMFALLVACLCHDLDHRGTNNAFQSKADSPLALLYGTSTMEHHHFDQCIMILNSEGNNILQALSPREYRRIITLIESAILSTDLALYFKKKGSFLQVVETGEQDWKKPQQKDLLTGMMMTACDVAAITKPWEVQYRVAHLVAAEFFEQGDLERQRLGEEPIAMMDRGKVDELPKMQVGFIDAICTPVYEMLTKVESGLSPLHDGCLNNRKNWQDLDGVPKNKITVPGINEAMKNESLATKMDEKTPMKKKNSAPNPAPDDTFVKDRNAKNTSKKIQNGTNSPTKPGKSKTCTIL